MNARALTFVAALLAFLALGLLTEITVLTNPEWTQMVDPTSQD